MQQTVLVVDDDPDFLEMLDAVLTHEGYRVVSCPIAGEAFPRAKQLRPRAVVLDLRMPDQPGWDVIEQLRGDPSTAEAHIIVCTAAVTEAMSHAAELRVRGCDLLPKPFELEDLLALLRNRGASRAS